MYQIKIIYDTGDSFHSEHGVEEILELEWSTMEKAEMALKAIEEHYAYYLTMVRNWDVDKKDKKQATKESQKQYWYDEECWNIRLNLLDDNNKKVKIHTFWTGYFESLVGAEVIQNLPSFHIR